MAFEDTQSAAHDFFNRELEGQRGGANDAWTEICTPAQAGAASIPYNGRQCRWPLTEESRLAIPPLFPRPPYSPACFINLPISLLPLMRGARRRILRANPAPACDSKFPSKPQRRNLSDKKKRKIISTITSFRGNLKISFGGLTMCAYAKWIGSADPRSSISKTERTNRPRARSRLYRRARRIPNAQDRRLSTYNVATEPYLGQK
jgi:hypothetical protein